MRSSAAVRPDSVTVYERHDRVGGLLRYGIPNMKLDKSIIDRRVEVMKAAGIKFICNADVGKDISGKELEKEYDRVILCGGKTFGHSGQGLDAARHSGAFGIISSCVTLAAPRRIEVPTQSFPVSPPPITSTFFPFASS